MIPNTLLTDTTAKSIVITGGAGDIGRAIARRHIRDNGRVVLVDISADRLESAEQELDADSNQILSIVADVTSDSQVSAFVEESVNFLGRLDGLFNNAGVEGLVAPIVEYPLEQFRHVIEVNLFGVLLGLKHVLPIMVKQGNGAIVNTASVGGIRGAANLSAYAASKHAVIGLTRTAALEVARHGVRVNAVCPSAVTGRMIRSIEKMSTSRPSHMSDGSFADLNPTKRLASADEVANVAAFLASDSASFVNGAAWVVDGGRTSG